MSPTKAKPRVGKGQDLACPACGNRVRTQAPNEWFTLHRRLCARRDLLTSASRPIEIRRPVGADG